MDGMGISSELNKGLRMQERHAVGLVICEGRLVTAALDVQYRELGLQDVFWGQTDQVGADASNQPPGHVEPAEARRGQAEDEKVLGVCACSVS